MTSIRRLAHGLRVVGARDDDVYVPGVTLPGTLVRPSFDCDSVEATSDENPEGDIHSATSGGSSQGGVTVTAEPGDPDVGDSEIPASSSSPWPPPHAASARATRSRQSPSRTLVSYEARSRRSDSSRLPTRAARRAV